MDSSEVVSREAVAEFNVRRWLWTWGGRSFGYRRGNSLYRSDGIEVGRFVDREVYGIDGAYLGELKESEDGERLITSNYKSSRSAVPFVPMVDRAQQRPTDRAGYPLYCGYHDFPPPEKVKAARYPTDGTKRTSPAADTIH